MKTKLSNILIGLQAISALCVIGAVKIWGPCVRQDADP